MTAVPGGRAALDVRRPFTRAQANAAGVSDRELESRRYRSLFRGIHVSATTPDSPALRAEGALLIFPATAFASHATAARLYRLPISPDADEHVSVAHKRDRRRRAGLRCHVAPDAPTRLREGLRVAAPEQLFLELAEQLSLVDLVIIGDHMVRRRLVQLHQLRRFCRAAKGRGAAQARAAAAFVRERVDSPMETRLRMLIVLAGLPEPEVNLTFGDEEGLAFRRYDLCWPQVKLVVEYDGRQHIERVEQWESDLDRREEIDDDGWRIVVVIAKGIYRTPESTLLKLHRILLERRMPGMPKRLADDWRPHFTPDA